MNRLLLLPLAFLFLLISCEKKETLSGQKWHKTTLSFQGPATGEGEKDNPFLNYRLLVTFTNGGKTYIIPGFYAGKGMNSVYFLTMNIEGDGKDVWPYVRHDERSRFDVSKLDQWEKVFDHMDNLGLMLHLVLQETENELLLDNGDTGPERKLYYRELIARFGHHLAITWNMGEENGPANFSPRGQNTRQQKDMVQYLKDHNPYPSFVVIHTHSDPKNRHAMYDKLLGFAPLNGPSDRQVA